MNNPRVPRTRLDNRRGRAPGNGLIRTVTDADTGSYGSEGRSPQRGLYVTPLARAAYVPHATVNSGQSRSLTVR